MHAALRRHDRSEDAMFKGGGREFLGTHKLNLTPYPPTHTHAPLHTPLHRLKYNELSRPGVANAWQ